MSDFRVQPGRALDIARSQDEQRKVLGLSSIKLVEGSPQIIPGTGTPEGVVTAPVGSLFLRSDGGAATTLYVKETGAGNTGWVAK